MSFEPLPIPLRMDETGSIRVGNTRVLLELVIHAYEDGSTPEGIVDSFDSLRLADVYAVIAYYLQNRQQVDEYLKRRDQEAEAIRREIEANQPPRPGFKEELLARWARLQEKTDAAAGQ